MPLFDPVGDFELVADGLASATLITRAGVEVSLTKVLQQEIDRKEVWASNGLYRSGDAYFHLSTSEYAAEPELGAQFRTSDSALWTILAVVRDTMGDRWECVARNLRVSEALTEQLSIWRAGDVERVAGGAMRPGMWIQEAAGVYGRLQKSIAERRVEHNMAIFPETATCVLIYTGDLDGTRRIRQADGTEWKVNNVQKKDRIDMLLEVELERTPWPLL